MLLKENYFIPLYGCFEASITLSKWRREVLWIQEKYFWSSMCFQTCLKRPKHTAHMQKWDGWWSPTLSKVQEEWDSVNTTRGKVGCECTNHKLLPCELPACVHQPSRKWKMAFAGAKSPQDVRVCFCRSHGAAGMLEVHVMAHLTPAPNLTARERA